MTTVFLLWEMLWDEDGGRVPFLRRIFHTQEAANKCKSTWKCPQDNGYVVVQSFGMDKEI